MFAYDFRHGAHINILESRSYKSLIKYLAKSQQGSRVPVCLDSSATLGSFAHGRSSSGPLCRVQQGALPYMLGGGIYLAGLQTPTAVHRADEPSRRKNIPAKNNPYEN